MKHLPSTIIIFLLFLIVLSTSVFAVQDRNLDCHRCGMHKAPPLVNVKMNLLGVGTITEYYPSSWTLIDGGGATYSYYNEDYNRLQWDNVVNNVTYIITSPQRTTPSTKYYFYLDEFIEDNKWMVIVADPTTYQVSSCSNATASLENYTNDFTGTYEFTKDLSCPTLQAVGSLTGCVGSTSTAFTGVVDFKNYSLSDVDCTGDGNVAIFGKTLHAIFKNGEVLNSTVWKTGSGNIAGFFISQCSNTTISQMYAEGLFNGSGGLNIGGWCGYTDPAPGLLLINSYSNISMPYFAGANRCGGMIGNAGTTGNVVRNSYVTGTDLGNCDGIQNFHSTQPSIEDSFSIVTTTGDSIGKGTCNGTYGCYYDGDNTPSPGGASGAVHNITSANTSFWTSASKATYGPFDVWDADVWKLDIVGLPIFQWQYEAPDTYPTWSNNITYGAPFNTGDTIYTWVFLSDDIELSHDIFSYNRTGIWQNVSAHDISNATSNASVSWVQNTKGNIGWKWYFNDSANQWNVTDVFFAYVTDQPPRWSNLSQSSDTSLQGVPVTVRSTWDNGFNLSWWQVQYWNTTAWENTSFYNFSYTATCAIDFNTSCNIELVLTNPRGIGNWSWFFRANDSSNQWNVTDKMNFSVTPDQPPQWSNNISNATDPIVLPAGLQSWVQWTDDTNLSHYICSWNKTGTWVNVTSGYLGNKSYNASCTGTISLPGIYGYRQYFNDSLNQWNATPKNIWNVPTLPGLATITNWEITPCFTSTFGRTSWQLGENFTLYVNVSGNTSHFVQARVIFYDGETNATGGNGNQTDSGWYGYTNTSPPFRFTFSFNITNVTTNSTLTMMARDLYNLTDVNISEWFSVVSYGGKLHGECTTSMDYVIEVVEPEEKVNILIGAFWTLARVSNMGLVIFWIFLMATISITLWIYMHSQPFLAAGLVLGANTILAFVGVRIGALTAPMFFILILFLVIAGIVIFKKQVMGN